MGTCNGRPVSEEDRRSDQIDKQIGDWKKSEQMMIKILLLGSGESGKSTIFKQMKILHANGFTNEERRFYRNLIQQNGVESMQSLARACHNLGIPFDHDENAARANRLLSIALHEPLQWNPLEDLECLLHDNGIRQAFYRSNEFHLLDSAQYWFERLRMIYAPNYSPSDQDILRSRNATTGIVKFVFEVDQLTFRLFDVGGQRGERKKWIHCFEQVTAILFIASLSEYDQNLLESRVPRNRMKEALELFQGIITLPWFRDTPIILFLNKSDIFDQKVLRSDLGKTFPQYQGGFNRDAALEFIQSMFLACNPRREDTTIFVHVTNATDEKNFKRLWQATKLIILDENIRFSGLGPMK